MAKWYKPSEVLKERKERKTKEKEERKKDYIKEGEGGPLFQYTTNRFFTRNLPWLIIPLGYVGVRERMGRIGLPIKSKADPEGREIHYENEYDESLSPEERYSDPTRVRVTQRTYPGGGPVEPGLRFMISLGGLWSRMAVVNTQLRTETIEATNVLTEGGTLQIPGIKAVMNYEVADAVRAMTKVRDFKLTTRQMAKATIENVMMGNTLEDIAKLKKAQTNLAQAEGIIDNPELRKIGITMSSLYLTDINLPDDLQQLLAAQTIAREQAQGSLEAAGLALQIAQKYQAAGAAYDSPGARFAAELDLLRTQVKGFQVNKVELGGLEELLRKFPDLVREMLKRPAA